MNEKSGTARERIRAALQENPDGLSKAELQRRAGINQGAFRRVYRSMIDTGQMSSIVVDVPGWGPTNMHYLSTGPLPGQEVLEDAGEPPHAV